MEFNPSKDQIAITIPAFRMRRPKDLGKNEIGIVSIAIDESGTANPSTSVFTNSFFIPSVKKWSWVKFGGHGRIIYGPKRPGSFVYYNVLFVESDQDVREFGETLQGIFKSGEASAIIQQIAGAGSIPAVIGQLGKLVGDILSKNKNDLIFSTEGSFFRDTNPPYNIGDRFSTINDFIECEVKVLPLIENSIGMSDARELASADTISATLSPAMLELESLAGRPSLIIDNA